MMGRLGSLKAKHLAGAANRFGNGFDGFILPNHTACAGGGFCSNRSSILLGCQAAHRDADPMETTSAISSSITFGFQGQFFKIQVESSEVG